MATRFALVVAMAALTAGCFPGVGTPKVFSGVHGGAGGSSDGGSKYCAIYPHLWASWDAPMTIPPTCPYEGWVRQVVRDIHEVAGCVSDKEPELRIVLAIDKQGVLTNATVMEPSSTDVRRCVYPVLRHWEFSSAQAAGEILVVYEPRKVKK